MHAQLPVHGCVPSLPASSEHCSASPRSPGGPTSPHPPAFSFTWYPARPGTLSGRGVTAWAGPVSSHAQCSDPPFYPEHLQGQEGEKSSSGLTSSSSLKIREKIKMKRTAEDLVIVYLEENNSHNAARAPAAQTPHPARGPRAIMVGQGKEGDRWAALVQRSKGAGLGLPGSTG